SRWQRHFGYLCLDRILHRANQVPITRTHRDRDAPQPIHMLDRRRNTGLLERGELSKLDDAVVALHGRHAISVRVMWLASAVRMRIGIDALPVSRYLLVLEVNPSSAARSAVPPSRAVTPRSAARVQSIFARSWVWIS